LQTGDRVVERNSGVFYHLRQSFQQNRPGTTDGTSNLGTARRRGHVPAGALEGRAELVRFRQGQGDAVLDLHKVPTLKNVQELHAQTSTALVSDSSPAKDFSVRDADGHIVEVKQVRQEITNADTGTTFLLAEKGLYLIRRPALETVSEVYLARWDSAAGESGKE
jgi:hypothetical protein